MPNLRAAGDQSRWRRRRLVTKLSGGFVAETAHGSSASPIGPQASFERSGGLERLFVGAQARVVVGLRHAEARRQLAVEQARALQFVEAGQVGDRVEPEMD